MKKVRNWVFGGIQQKVFNLVLITIILLVGAYTSVIIYQMTSLSSLVEETNQKQKEAITEISGRTMDSVLDGTMVQSSQTEAYIVDDLFRDLASSVQMMADYAEKILEDPEAFSAIECLPPDPAKDGETTLQLLTKEGVNPKEKRLSVGISKMANLANLMGTIYDCGDINSCYAALPEGILLLVDDRPGEKVSEDGTPISIDVRERPWYQGAEETGKLFFTDVERDYYNNKIGIMCSMPVYHNGKLAAVVGADYYLDAMEAAVEASVKEGSFVCIVNERGHVVFSPKKEGIFQAKVGSDAQDLRESENAELASFIGDALQSSTDVRTVEADGTMYYMCGSPVGIVGWTLLNVVEKEATDQATVALEQQYEQISAEATDSFRKGLDAGKQTIVILILVILLLALAAALSLANRIVKPLETITKRIASLGGTNLQFKMEDAFRTDDEIQVLAESFADLSAKTVHYVQEVKKVTAEKERIGTELDLANQIQASQLPRLFPAFPNRSEFDVFASMTPAKEVGGDFYDFFLTDEDHICLVMADVSGKGIPAALFMMISRVLIKTRIQNGESPAEALRNVNTQLCEGNEAEFFVTVWIGLLQISTGKGIAANAGHEHPAVRRAGSEYGLVVYRHSPAVAAMEGISFREHIFELRPGDSLFVYTDGVAEATNAQNELYGTDRMLDALNRNPDAEPEEVLANVDESIRAFVGDAEQFDDITMLCLKYNGPA